MDAIFPAFMELFPVGRIMTPVESAYRLCTKRVNTHWFSGPRSLIWCLTEKCIRHLHHRMTIKLGSILSQSGSAANHCSRYGLILRGSAP